MKWISVKDKLPEEGKKILVYEIIDGKYDKRGIICFYNKPKNLNNPRLRWHKITHWMPLPKPPEE